MKALDRKLVRDLAHLKGQLVTIALVIACGVAGFISTMGTYRSVEAARDRYYEAARFADVFAHLERAPRSLMRRVRAIPGVHEAEDRIVVEALLDLPGVTEPAVARLISAPEDAATGINRLDIRAGRLLRPGRGHEVLVGEAFAKAHGLGPGDSVRIVMRGRRERLRIAGVALSPEYVFAAGTGEITSDDKRFGVFWMDRDALASVFGMTSAFNDVVGRLGPFASRSEVLRRLDLLFERFGGLGAHGRDEQLSARIVDGELEQLSAMAKVVPALFLLVAAFLVHVVASRLVDAQRPQLAEIKALGYGGVQIGAHYLKLVLLIVAAGTVVGTALGTWLGREQTELYEPFFRFPILAFRLEPSLLAQAAVVSVLAGTVGAGAAVVRAVRLPPAEAMRPAAPPVYRPTVLERLGMRRLVGPSGRMVLRDLERHPMRTLVSALLIALSMGIVIAGRFSMDTIDRLLELQFGWAQREDVALSLIRPASLRALDEIRALPGVLRVEPIRTVPARVRSAHRRRDIVVTGLSPDGRLRQIVDIHGNVFPIPDRGALVSRKLGELLDLRVGDNVRVEVLEGDRAVRDVTVAAFVDDLVGLQMTLAIGQLHRLRREQGSVSGALLEVDAAELPHLLRRIETLPMITAVQRRERAVEQFRAQHAEIMLVVTAILVAFASVIAIGVVYNNARVAVSVRSRDLATLRVLGFTRREVSAILVGEQAIQIVAAVPLGLAVGQLLAALVTRMIDPELFRLPLVVSSQTRLFAVGVVVAAALGSAVALRRRLDKLDLVGVLKAPE